jgi:hypothetical protein
MQVSGRLIALVPTAVVLISILLIPLWQLEMLSMMPGDIGDARLNNYFLENTYQFMVDGTNSLWHLPFFYPFPYVLGFSDNLFGAAPIYIFARLFGARTDDAYQIWFLFGYVANFIAAYYALRRLNGSIIASTIGAFIFTFALPTSAHAGHAQLHYRFGLPLAIVFFSDFLNTKLWRYLLISGAWVVWQLYAGVYIGFFTLLLLATMSLTYLGYVLINGRGVLKDSFRDFIGSWKSQTKTQMILFLCALSLLLVLLLLLFYPYLQVTQLYGAKRTWSEIATMLPRPQSYLLSDKSFLGSFIGADIFSGIPMRHEHQMFFGALPLALALAGLIVGSRKNNGPDFTLMTGMLTISIVLTLYIGGFSFWFLVHQLPLASAIRAMTRIDQAFLFPIAYLAVIAIDKFRVKYAWAKLFILGLILPLLIFEAATTSMGVSSKESWRQRVLALEAVVPKKISDNSILFFAQRSGPIYADEIDAMWVSLRHDKQTMNGYSGNYPPDYDYDFGDDCDQLLKRVLSYLKFSNQSNNVEAYLMSRIIPIGFNNCDAALFKNPPSVTSVDSPYSQEEFKALSYGKNEIIKNGNRLSMRITIVNSSNKYFSANSAIGKPIRISWRYLDKAGNPLSGWDARKNLPYDIPDNGELQVSIPLDPSKLNNSNSLQVSLVQELVFWGHDIGVTPLTIPLK